MLSLNDDFSLYTYYLFTLLHNAVYKYTETGSARIFRNGWKVFSQQNNLSLALWWFIFVYLMY